MGASLSYWIKQRPLVSYFILAYAITWVIWSPSILFSRGLFPFNPPVFLTSLGSFGPALAAVTVLSVTGGKEQVRQLLQRLLNWQVGWGWWAVLVGLPLILNGALIAAYGLLNGITPNLGLATWLNLLPLVFHYLAFGGPLGEEPGWRGFALPRLQVGRSALSASLILALFWFGWHLPRYLDPSFIAGGTLAIAFFALQVLLLTILFTWAYNNTGSLLLVVLFHAAINAFAYAFPLFYPEVQDSDLALYFAIASGLSIVVLALWALIVVVAFWTDHLTRA